MENGTVIPSPAFVPDRPLTDQLSVFDRVHVEGINKAIRPALQDLGISTRLGVANGQHAIYLTGDQAALKSIVDDKNRLPEILQNAGRQDVTGEVKQTGSMIYIIITDIKQ
jgi:hypothetical protein